MSCSVVARPEIVKNIGDSIWYIENINIRGIPTYIDTELSTPGGKASRGHTNNR